MLSPNEESFVNLMPSCKVLDLLLYVAKVTLYHIPAVAARVTTIANGSTLLAGTPTPNRAKEYGTAAGVTYRTNLDQ